MFEISVLSSNNSCSVEGKMPADVIKLCVCICRREALSLRWRLEILRPCQSSHYGVISGHPAIAVSEAYERLSLFSFHTCLKATFFFKNTAFVKQTPQLCYVGSLCDKQRENF